MYFQTDPVRSVSLSSSSIANTIQYWNKVLDMNVLANDDKFAQFSYDNNFRLNFNLISEFPLKLNYYIHVVKYLYCNCL